MYHIRFLDAQGKTELTRREAPEVYRLYERSVLLCLLEQQVLTREAFDWCIRRLEREAGPRETNQPSHSD